MAIAALLIAFGLTAVFVGADAADSAFVFGAVAPFFTAGFVTADSVPSGSLTAGWLFVTSVFETFDFVEVFADVEGLTVLRFDFDSVAAVDFATADFVEVFAVEVTFDEAVFAPAFTAPAFADDAFGGAVAPAEGLAELVDFFVVTLADDAPSVLSTSARIDLPPRTLSGAVAFTPLVAFVAFVAAVAWVAASGTFLALLAFLLASTLADTSVAFLAVAVLDAAFLTTAFSDPEPVDAAFAEAFVAVAAFEATALAEATVRFTTAFTEVGFAAGVLAFVPVAEAFDIRDTSLADERADTLDDGCAQRPDEHRVSGLCSTISAQRNTLTRPRCNASLITGPFEIPPSVFVTHGRFVALSPRC